jgi:hypothetical protein
VKEKATDTMVVIFSIASPPWRTDLLLTRYRTCLCKIAFFWLTPFIPKFSQIFFANTKEN